MTGGAGRRREHPVAYAGLVVAGLSQAAFENGRQLPGDRSSRGTPVFVSSTRKVSPVMSTRSQLRVSTSSRRSRLTLLVIESRPGRRGPHRTGGDRKRPLRKEIRRLPVCRPLPATGRFHGLPELLRMGARHAPILTRDVMVRWRPYGPGLSAGRITIDADFNNLTASTRILPRSGNASDPAGAGGDGTRAADGPHLDSTPGCSCSGVAISPYRLIRNFTSGRIVTWLQFDFS